MKRGGKGCPNDDPQFTKMLSRWVEPTPQTRQHLFYLVCIPVRFVLYYLVYMYRDTKAVQIAVALLSILTMVHLYPSLKKEGRQWWSKRADFIMSAFLLCASIGAYTGHINPIAMPIILYITLVEGIIRSLFIKFC